MAEVLFYHLTESKLEDALPPLVDKTVARGWKAVLQFDSEERRDAADAQLWTWRDSSFLPHGVDGGPFDERQPVLLTTGTGNPNGANIRFLAGGADIDDVSPYQRVVVMFDGHDNDQLEKARGQWKRLSGQGHQLTYWQQTTQGGWERKA